MPIQNIVSSMIGQVGVVPRIVYIQTNDNYNTITASGYLNGPVAAGTPFAATDMVLVSGTDISNGAVGPNWFKVVISGSAAPYTYSLAAITSYD